MVCGINNKLFTIIVLFYFSSNQKLTLAQQQLQADYEKVKAEETEKSNKLQELMSVDNLSCKKRSIPCSDNKSLKSPTNYVPSPVYITPPKAETWAKFMPYKNECTKEKSIPKSIKKSDKNELNQLAKTINSNANNNNNNQCTMSIFHIHNFHLHLFISLTLLLVTHKCPTYVIVD